MSHQPLGDNSIASSGAVDRSTVTCVLPPVGGLKSFHGASTPVWISTSSRPIGAGSHPGNMDRSRVSSPTHPPPLPPPPPSPQLVPLKARLARSKSVSSSPTRPFAGPKATKSQWDALTSASRRAAFRQGPSRSLKESSTNVDYVKQSLTAHPAVPDHSIDCDIGELAHQSTSGVFYPIVHPRERNILTVCLASLVFLTVSVAVTTSFAAFVLPFFLVAFAVRRLGVWVANCCQYCLCCRCNRWQLRTSSTSNLLAPFFSRMFLSSRNRSEMCQCLFPEDELKYFLQPLCPLTPAELRWLPEQDLLTHGHDTPLHSSINTPVVVICLRFGSPGLRLASLRETIAHRLLYRYSSSSSISSPRGSSFSDRLTQRQRTCSLIPPADTLARLTQCLTDIPTGYAWRECLAFRLEDHVINVPEGCLNGSMGKRRESQSSSSSAEIAAQPYVVNVETLIKSLNSLPLMLNRPLWQAYLLEEYQEIETNEPSDVDSDAESDEPINPQGKWSSPKRANPSPTKSLRSRNLSDELKSSNPTSSLLYRRSGTTGVGSLLVFRLHAALSDDGRALVHLLTNCLADPPIRTQSSIPTHSHTTAYSVQKELRSVSKGAHESTHPHITSSYKPSSPLQTVGVTRNVTKPPLPDKSYLNKMKKPVADTGAGQQVKAKCDSLLSELLPSHNRSSTETDDDDPDEFEAAQWWFSFWSSSMATIVTYCDLIRAVLTGPALILHKYFFTQADMGILIKAPTVQASHSPPDDSLIKSVPMENGCSVVYKSALLSLVKLSRVRQVTKCSYSEIILSLLAGGLRAYHQMLGIRHPSDLLTFLSIEVPVLPNCSMYTLQNGFRKRFNSCRDESSCKPYIWPSQRATRTPTSSSTSVSDQLQHECSVETGLVGNTGRMIAVASPPAMVNNLRPGRRVLTDICLPINTEGMLPRLWEIRQRLTELNNSVDPLCLSWSRSILYTLLSHHSASRLESTYGSSAKASVSVTGVEVVSPFNSQNKASVDNDSNQGYQMSPNRRLAYMSLLAGKSAEARTLRRRLRNRLPRGALIHPPSLGTSFRALARHLINANAGLIFIAGSPIVRIDTWMPTPCLSNCSSPLKMVSQNVKSNWFICRDLSVTFTTYAGQLSLTFSAKSAVGSHLNLDLVIHAMQSQLRKLFRLLSGRHAPSSTDRWLSRSLNVKSRNTSSTAVNRSPSLNPSVVLHQESPTPIQPNPGSSTCASNKQKRPLKSPSSSPLLESPANPTQPAQPWDPKPKRTALNERTNFGEFPFELDLIESTRSTEQDSDFFIDEIDEDEYYDEDMGLSENETTVVSQLGVNSSTLAASTGEQKSWRLYERRSFLATLLGRKIEYGRECATVRKRTEYRRKTKRRRCSSTKCRRPPFLSADVTTLDLTPIRRGSLGSASSAVGVDHFIAKLINRKSNNAVSITRYREQSGT